MFKTFFASKFKLSNHNFLSSFSGIGGESNSTIIGNYIINYPAYKSHLDKTQQEKSNRQSEASKKDSLQVKLRKSEILNESNWEFIRKEGENQSELTVKLHFNDEASALDLISLIKDKCDEMDHHPSWKLTCDSENKEYILKINLTSHFENNNVTEKDYELGAFIQYEYERMMMVVYKNKYRKYFEMSCGLFVSVLLFTFTYEKYKKWNSIHFLYKIR